MYSDLLSIGRKSLIQHSIAPLSRQENITGIEESLTGKWLNQILNLNYYVYTTASTNYPGEQFQAFFVVFNAPEKLCDAIVEYLDPFKYAYAIKRLKYDEQSGNVDTDPIIAHLVKSNDVRDPC